MSLWTVVKDSRPSHVSFLILIWEWCSSVKDLPIICNGNVGVSDDDVQPTERDHPRIPSHLVAST